MLFGLYQGLTRLLGPLAPLILNRRATRGKEDPARRGERLGQPSVARPDGKLIWLHAASVGESFTAQILIDRLTEAHPVLHFLLTTGTVTSANLAAQRLPEKAIHQYVPIDRPDCVDSFMNHWQPDAAIWLESELWPNLLNAISQAGIPAILANARLSERSHANWSKAPGFARRMVGTFDLVLPGDGQSADRYASLGARSIGPTGNIKSSAKPLQADPDSVDALKEAIGGRPVWLAASTHPGEEAIVLQARAALQADQPDLLTIIAPRHPQRADEVIELLKADKLTFAQRSKDQLPAGDSQIYLADTLGELGILYRAVDLVFVGGSLTGQGGHNPIEPAQLDCAIVTGPDTQNFADLFADMTSAQAVRPLADSTALTATIGSLLQDVPARRGLAKAALAQAQAKSAIADHALEAMAPVLARAGIGE